MRVLLRIAAVLFFASCTKSLSADEWPDFRGPTGDGQASAATPPHEWSETRNVAWKTNLPGRGWSTPILVGPLLWMSSADEEGHQLFAVGIDRDSGSIEHRVELFEIDEPEACNAMNSFASPSPVTDGLNVYFSFGTYGVAAIEAARGTIVWSRDDVNLDHQEGPGSSPVLCNDRLLLHCDGRDRQYVVALDTANGEVAWRRERSLDLSHVGDFARKAFTTPLLITTEHGDRIISPAAQGCYCYEPNTGQEIWSVRYPGFSAVPRPVVSNGVAFVVDGFANPSIHAIRINGQKDITSSHVQWTFRRGGPATTSPVHWFDELVFVTDEGILVSLDEQTGELNWRERIGGRFCASPIVIGDLIYLFDRDGKASVLRFSKDGARPEVVATNQLDEGMMASPVAIDEALYLRTKQSLYCIREEN